MALIDEQIEFRPLTREEIVSVIEGHSTAPRVPMLHHFWTSAAVFGAHEAEAAALLAKYPCDIVVVPAVMPGGIEGNPLDPSYRWLPYDAKAAQQSAALDSHIAMPDWDRLDEVIENFPKASSPAVMSAGIPADDGRYRLGHWWFTLFERHWSLRGMENCLTDYAFYPEETHRLYAALADYYCGVLERLKDEGHCDGVFVSDDLGTQNSTFFSPKVFKEFFEPYYAKMIGKAHELGMHFWLHTCGCVTPFMPEFIKIGLDVIHPIQKYTMDEREIAEKFGSQITILAGMDVQQTIPWGSPDDVRREVRFMIDTYQRPEGRLMMTAGNGITPDCPLASLEALLDETLRYGTAKVRELKG
ncbi:MAG: uroporphyrinogen decarboxylase family protein [Armatimonadota bacterium]